MQLGRFIIMVEAAGGLTCRAFTWVGRASDGIAKARTECLAEGRDYKDIWAVPAAANRNPPEVY